MNRNSMDRRIAITGMSVNTPLGDSLDVFLDNLLLGRSAITHWKQFAEEPIYSKIGGDLSGYDVQAKLKSFENTTGDETFDRLKSLMKRAPWVTKLTMLLAADAYKNANLRESGYDAHKIATIVAGHNINQNYVHQSRSFFQEEPDYIDGLFALYGLDTDHAGSVSEILQLRGPSYTVGGACASGNIALAQGIDQIRHRGLQAVLIVAPVLDFSPIDLHGMALMGAISYRSFNDTPSLASRPYDIRREGFVPCHGGAVLVIENLEEAEARGAHIYAEVLGADSNSDGNHLPQPSQAGQAYLMSKLLQENHLHPEQIDYVSAHATSTPLGDITEVRSIKQVFGSHAYNLKVNAPKSMLGHTCWSAATVETVAAVLQMNRGILHASINIENLDPEVDLDICREQVHHEVNTFMKNSFGFGGINSIGIFRRHSTA